MQRRENPANIIGRQVGRYTVVSHLASGGMAELYIARQDAVGGFEKNLVLKLLQPRYAENPRVVQMFLDEARLAAKLNHPSIVNVYDVAEDEGIKYIAMEYIHGETIMDIIRRGIAVGNYLPIEHAVHIVSQTAAGLAYAHGRHGVDGALLRIVHRDVSPSNVLVSYEGQTKIVDFGIARIQDQIREESGMRPGKASYMSPEQVAGASADYRSDIFSLGIILYEVTLGQRLFRGPAEDVMRRIVEDKIPPPTTVKRDYPPALELIVMKALEKRPADRYQSAEDMRNDLEELLDDAGLRTGPRRVALYLKELFAPDAPLSDDGVAESRQLGDVRAGAQAPADDSEELNFDRRASLTLRVEAAPPRAPAAPSRTASEPPGPASSPASSPVTEARPPAATAAVATAPAKSIPAAASSASERAPAPAVATAAPAGAAAAPSIARAAPATSAARASSSGSTSGSKGWLVMLLMALIMMGIGAMVFVGMK